jgi:H+/gluconate symporter-like permease
MPHKFFNCFNAGSVLIIAIPLSFLHLKNKLLVDTINFVSNPTMALFIALIIATYLLGVRHKRSIKTIMRWYESSIKDISIILLIIGGAGP